MDGSKENPAYRFGRGIVEHTPQIRKSSLRLELECSVNLENVPIVGLVKDWFIPSAARGRNQIFEDWSKPRAVSSQHSALSF
jgi:hypothetical protein